MKIAGRLQMHSVAVVALVVLLVRLILGTPLSELAVPAIVACMLVLVIGRIVAVSITRPIDELAGVARALALGDQTSRPPLSAPGEVGELATAVHRLAEQLSARMVAQHAEESLLAALIESLNEGVVAIGQRQQVLRINSAGRTLLRVTDDVPFGVDRLPRVRELQYAIQAALQGATTEPFELAVSGHTLSLTARPLTGGGAVLAFFDLTRIRQLEMVRRDFVANVSHELRTPLTVIAGFAETLADDDLPLERRRQFAKTIYTHTERMQRIVDDLLDLSRLESGRWTPSVSEQDVAAVAADALSSVQASADAKGLNLQVEVSAPASSLIADITALRQVLANLLENAVRHTSFGHVTVFADREIGGVWIGVRDSGPGIGAEHLPRIFERFYRVDAGRTRDSGGTGLGLAIVKHLVETHGGRVRAESAIGHGTTIAAFFPDRPHAA
ncbi:MAG: ATP-binding protein [Gemmatimonadaceae bacterium]